MKNKKIAIAIDGPAAAGKSTVSKLVANKLSYIYIDTGAMYRALTLKALRCQIALEDEKAITALLMNTTIDIKQTNGQQLVLIDEEDVTDAIRSDNISNSVSYVAQHAHVRHEMVKRQQELAKKRGVVMDGRDIGTHVIPDAEVKIFLRASVEERARRRYDENIQKGLAADYQTLKDEIKQRDDLDSRRKTAPLLKAEDAVELDTTNLSTNEAVLRILNIVENIRAGTGS